mgnify:CR=1 FL=1
MGGIVLALDLASCTGWAVGSADARPAYGSVRLEGRERAARYAALFPLYLAHGLRVGEVTTIEIMPSDPSKVVATIMVA